MEFSPFYILIVYVLVVGVFVFLGILNVYHVIRFSHLRAPSIIMSLLFFIATVGIVLGTFTLLRDIDWSEPISISIPTLSAEPENESGINYEEFE